MARSDAAAVYVHGLWMPGFEGALLRRRLRAERGFRCYVFRYGSVREPMRQVAAALRQMVARIDAPRVHLLGHSLGGLVIQRYLQRYTMAQPGRVLFLGTPSAGSRAARRLGSLTLGRRLMGHAVGEELLVESTRRWEAERELGIIAGTVPVGLGHLLLKFGEDNDGTIAVSETELAGAKARLCLPVTHSGMLLSARVAREAGSFLEHGRFGA
ncbi:MAG TPA: alpha/beta fold hydrolase [Steroidobacteraceae bacterium]|nr:alpha/beta fold hydrolase [Steroidobacteraceae bacterium]